MWGQIAKKISFVSGSALVLLGTVQLYLGLSVAGNEEALFASAASAFMVLFPGAVFVSYSLQSVPRFSSRSEPAGVLLNADEPVFVVPEGDNVVVAFPSRPLESGAVKPATKIQSK